MQNGNKKIIINDLEYADDIVLTNNGLDNATKKFKEIVKLSKKFAGLNINFDKTKCMQINKGTWKISKTTEDDCNKMNWKNICQDCKRAMPGFLNLLIHKKRWCQKTKNTRSRIGTLADKLVKKEKKKQIMNRLPKIQVNKKEIENVYEYIYLGTLFTADADQDADIENRIKKK